MSAAGNLEPKSNATVAAARIAAAQFGVVWREQLLDCGFSASGIYRRLNSGELIEMFPRIYRFASAPKDSMQEIFAAVKWAGEGALASHNSAARVWQLDGTWGTTLEISTSRNIHCQDLVIVHRRLVMPQDSGRMYGIPVTSSALTLLDLCNQFDKPQMEVALDDALRRGIVTMPRLRWTAKTVGRRGKKGTRLFNELLEERPRAADLTDSGLEVRFLRIIMKAHLPEPVPQYRVFEGKRFIGRPDFAYPDKRVAIELESYKYHQGRARWKKDLKRQDAFSEAGWIVRHFTYDDLVGDPEGVCYQVRRALGL